MGSRSGEDEPDISVSVAPKASTMTTRSLLAPPAVTALNPVDAMTRTLGPLIFLQKLPLRTLRMKNRNQPRSRFRPALPADTVPHGVRLQSDGALRKAAVPQAHAFDAHACGLCHALDSANLDVSRLGGSRRKLPMGGSERVSRDPTAMGRISAKSERRAQY